MTALPTLQRTDAVADLCSKSADWRRLKISESAHLWWGYPSRPACGGESSRLAAGWKERWVGPAVTDGARLAAKCWILIAQNADTGAQKATCCSVHPMPQRPNKWWFETRSRTRELKYSNWEKKFWRINIPIRYITGLSQCYQFACDNRGLITLRERDTLCRLHYQINIEYSV